MLWPLASGKTSGAAKPEGDNRVSLKGLEIIDFVMWLITSCERSLLNGTAEPCSSKRLVKKIVLLLFIAIIVWFINHLDIPTLIKGLYAFNKAYYSFASLYMNYRLHQMQEGY